MQSYEVLVGYWSVEVTLVGSVSHAHARAVVDGEPVVYRIKRHGEAKDVDKSWFERGLTFVHYHAKNLGTHVKFEVADKRKKRRKKVADTQKTFL